MNAVALPSAADRRTAERERITQACEALLTSEGWRRWVRARSVFRSYSINNQILIAFQAPEATRVAGFQAWRKLGRQVRAGERSIRIIAPITIHKQDEAGEDGVILRFRSVPVFDIAQTDKIPGAPQVLIDQPGKPITGDSHAHLIPILEGFASELGYVVEYKSTGVASGYHDSKGKLVAVSDSLSVNGRVQVLVHEMCHALGADYKTYPRDECEVIVETAAMIICASVGLDVSSESVPYITGWARKANPTEAITRFAGVIDELAARIETIVIPQATRATNHLPESCPEP